MTDAAVRAAGADSTPMFLATPIQFRAWLKRNTSLATELIVGFHKVGCGTPSMTWPQSVDEALCVGWRTEGLTKPQPKPLRKTTMPTPATLESFIARVEQNAHVEAIEEFYTEGATMQENQSPPRIGRDALVAGESRVMARAKSVSSTCVRPVFVSGDHVVVRWIFRFEWADGSITCMEELACQRWAGERIAEEQFFYDPAQRVPTVPSA